MSACLDCGGAECICGYRARLDAAETRIGQLHEVLAKGVEISTGPVLSLDALVLERNRQLEEQAANLEALGAQLQANHAKLEAQLAKLEAQPLMGWAYLFSELPDEGAVGVFETREVALEDGLAALPAEDQEHGEYDEITVFEIGMVGPIERDVRALRAAIEQTLATPSVELGVRGRSALYDALEKSRARETRRRKGGSR